MAPIGMIQETQKENRVTVSESDIADVVSMMTGIPVNRVAESEGIRLTNLANQIKSKIIGQDQVVEKVVRAIQRNRAGLKNPKKPIGSFIFLGQTSSKSETFILSISKKNFDFILSNRSILRTDLIFEFKWE